MAGHAPSTTPTSRWLWRGAVAFVAAALLAGISLITWSRVTAAADSTARTAMDSDDTVIVARGDWISFRPRDVEPETGLIFYPGGKAEPAAYAPMLRRLAADGYFVVLTPMPLNLAILAPERAGSVMSRYPEIRRWVLAGHSLGGVMAAEYAERHPADVAGLVLWASYPADFTDLSRAPWPVLSIGGSADALATPAKLSEARSRLPRATRDLVIAGGDHWNFANFDPALSTATINRSQQQSQVLDATEQFLASLQPPPEDP